LNPGKFWFIAILGLVFPLLSFVVIIFMVCWLLVRSRWVWLSFFALLISWQQLSSTFTWHSSQSSMQAKPNDNLRILSWNVSSWDEYNKKRRGGVSYRQAMLQEVKKCQADVLCFQEFFEPKDTTAYEPNIAELKKMGYPFHHYASVDGYVVPDADYGIIIFSKYPIINTGIFDFRNGNDAQQLIYADIEFNRQKARLITIHLQSVKFGPEEYQSLNEMKHSGKEGFKDSRTIVSKLKRAYTARSLQADIVRDYVNESPYPVILCGDFNDVPNSYTYFTIRGNMQDAFLKKGSGIGRTFRFISPTLRIDFILADKKFTVNQYHRITVPYSDHYGHFADIGF
jgi:endonuclease/exonuclease/phosphatase family metal-dependent hydrolase